MPQGYSHTIAGLSEHQPECRIVSPSEWMSRPREERHKNQTVITMCNRDSDCDWAYALGHYPLSIISGILAERPHCSRSDICWENMQCSVLDVHLMISSCAFFFHKWAKVKITCSWYYVYHNCIYIYISKYTFCSKGTSSGMTHTCMVHRNYINHETIQSLLRTHSHVKLIRRGWVRSGQARQLAQKKARVHHHKQRLGIGVSAWRPLKAMW